MMSARSAVPKALTPGTGPLGAVALCAVDNGGEKRRDRDPEDRENPDGMLMEMVLRTR
jgi:hypothetical protein